MNASQSIVNKTSIFTDIILIIFVSSYNVNWLLSVDEITCLFTEKLEKLLLTLGTWWQKLHFKSVEHFHSVF